MRSSGLNTQSNYTSSRQKQDGLRSALSQDNLKIGKASVVRGGMMNLTNPNTLLNHVEDEGVHYVETNSIKPYIMMNKRSSVPTVKDHIHYKSPENLTIDSQLFRNKMADSFETEPYLANRHFKDDESETVRTKRDLNLRVLDES